MSGRGGYAFVEGATSDLAFEAWGRDLPEVFAAAAEAVLAATVEHPERVVTRLSRPVALEEPDLELLLLQFLNELVYLRDAKGMLMRAEELRVDPGPPARLQGRVAGERIEAHQGQLATDVKAATAHGLSVRREPVGWRVRVTLDV